MKGSALVFFDAGARIVISVEDRRVRVEGVGDLLESPTWFDRGFPEVEAIRLVARARGDHAVHLAIDPHRSFLLRTYQDASRALRFAQVLGALLRAPVEVVAADGQVRTPRVETAPTWPPGGWQDETERVD